MHEYGRAAFAAPQATVPVILPAPARLHLLSPADLTESDVSRWNELGLHPATSSVFAQPWFTRAGIAHCAGGRRLLLAVVSDRSGDWLGVIPLVRRLRYGKAPFPHWAAWDHPNQFRGTPLIRRGEVLRFWRTLLAGFDRQGFGRLALRLNGLPLDDTVTQALIQACAEDRRAWKIDRRYARPVLLADRPDPHEAVKGSRRRRIASLERKAERELGPLDWRVTGGAGEIETALARFLALERAGWKGDAGSALASATATSRFFSAIARDAALAGQIEIAELLAGGRLLAASVHLIGQNEGFGYKMAYDEASAAYGPGLLLLNRLTAHFLASGLSRVDSCCAPGQEPIGSLWSDRMTLVDCGVALGRGPARRALDLLRIAEACFHGEPSFPRD